MNQLAEEEGYYVVYPAQSARDNPTKCWNWFRPADQCRDRGEPAIIAELTRHVVRVHRLDPARVYVAGLSAGAAMAVILARTYPDIYAAAGIHSGLPYGSAHDVPSAFAAMKQGSGTSKADTNATNQAFGVPVPTIVFHGDRDTVVGAHNGDIVIAQSMAGLGDNIWNAGSYGEQNKQGERGVVPGGYSYTRTMLRDPQGRVLAEQSRVRAQPTVVPDDVEGGEVHERLDHRPLVPERVAASVRGVVGSSGVHVLRPLLRRVPAVLPRPGRRHEEDVARLFAHDRVEHLHLAVDQRRNLGARDIGNAAQEISERHDHPRSGEDEPARVEGVDERDAEDVTDEIAPGAVVGAVVGGVVVEGRRYRCDFLVF